MTVASHSKALSTPDSVSERAVLTRVAVGFGLALGAVLLISLGSYFGVRGATQTFRGFESSLAAQTAATEIDMELLWVRALAQQYVYSGDAALVPKVKEHIGRFEYQLSEGEKLFVGDQQQAVRDQLVTGLRTLSANFEQVIAHVEAKDSHPEKLLPLIDTSELVERSEQIQRLVSKRADGLGADTHRNLTAASRSILGLGLGGAVATVVLGWVMGRKMLESAKTAARREQRTQQIEQLIAEFDHEASLIIGSVASAAKQMQATAMTLTAAAEETSAQSTSVAVASEQTSSNVQTVASAAEELSASIGEISRQVSHSAQIAGTAVTEAERTNVQVEGLSEAAQKIGDVVQLITDIAGQTNLLALNATIEAARAGDAGKGFAVVASEVKNLANETAKATDRITDQIAAVQQATREAVAAIQSIGSTISELSNISSAIAASVKEQGAATQEIARNVAQASVGTHEVSSNIAGVTQAAVSTGASAEQVLGVASELSQQSELLRGKVVHFVSGIKAA